MDFRSAQQQQQLKLIRRQYYDRLQQQKQHQQQQKKNTRATLDSGRLNRMRLTNELGIEWYFGVDANQSHAQRRPEQKSFTNSTKYPEDI